MPRATPTVFDEMALWAERRWPIVALYERIAAMVGGGGGDSGGSHDPWLPEELADSLRGVSAVPGGGMASLTDLYFCVVDELVENRAVVVVSPWPTVDDEGRRIFPEREEDGDEEGSGGVYQEIGVDVPTLQAFLNARRSSEHAGQNRPVSIGDVFAFGANALAQLQTATLWGFTLFEMPDEELVVDVTRAARGAAKAAFSRIIAPDTSEGLMRPDPGDDNSGSGTAGASPEPPSGAAPSGGAPQPLLPEPWGPEALTKAMQFRIGEPASPQQVLEEIQRMYRYCVVDEIVGDRALLITTAWPLVEPGGARLFPAPADEAWEEEDEEESLSDSTAFPSFEPMPQRYREFGVATVVLQEFLQRHREGDEEPPDRPVRVGDVLAMSEAALARLEVEEAGEEAAFHSALEDHAVVDLTLAARGAAKAAFSRIVAPAEAGTITTDPDDDDPGTATSTRGPDNPPYVGPDKGAALDVPVERRQPERERRPAQSPEVRRMTR